MSASASPSRSVFKRVRSAVTRPDYVLPRNSSHIVRGIFENPDHADVLKKTLEPFLAGREKGHTLTKAAMKAALHAVMLAHLKKDVYTRLRPTDFGGVGVFAIRDIPAGVYPFKSVAGVCPAYENAHVSVRKEDVSAIDERLSAYLSDFLISQDNDFPIPLSGPNRLTQDFFLNHSDAPNLSTEYRDDCEYSVYKTNRLIRAGEQLTIDYRAFNTDFAIVQKQLDPKREYLPAASRSPVTRS